ncbi:MAG: hypothetical protein MUF81_02690 [Verrucomicrobia bacterium]|jgi:hypothetical protein|nr:hypothetical protein [Verrucomicrobiota bacterium]
MKYFWVFLFVASFAGCSSSRVSRYDEFEKVKVDKMRGNAVAGTVFARTIVCLNAVRESKGFVAQTNVNVSFTTNYVVTSTTNLTVTTSGNQQIALLTNAVAAPAPSAETNGIAVIATAPANSGASGVTTATTRNESLSTAPNQTVRSGSIQVVTSLNSQATIGKDSLSITSGTNEVSTVETNYLVTTLTNQVVTPVTNTVVKTSENPVADYYLYTEIAPADFPLAPGESLIVLADGVRYGCMVATPLTAWESRRGFLTTYYKVAPEVIVAIANAKEAKLRIKGTTGTLERKMNGSSRANFRKFLLKNFGPSQQAGETKSSNS